LVTCTYNHIPITLPSAPAARAGAGRFAWPAPARAPALDPQFTQLLGTPILQPPITEYLITDHRSFTDNHGLRLQKVKK
jgi:hypothetical protein